MVPHRALLSIPGAEHGWSARGRARPICAAVRVVKINAKRADRRNRKRSMSSGNAIKPWMGNLPDRALAIRHAEPTQFNDSMRLRDRLGPSFLESWMTGKPEVIPREDGRQSSRKPTSHLGELGR